MKQRLINEGTTINSTQPSNEGVAEEAVTYTYNKTETDVLEEPQNQEIQEKTEEIEFVSESVVVPEIPKFETEQPEITQESVENLNEDEVPQAVKSMKQSTNIIEDIVNSKIEEKTENFEEMYLKLFGTKPKEKTKETNTNW